MVSKALKIVWSRRAQRQLEQVYQYIKLDSMKNAEKVKESIIDAVEQLARNVHRHAPDKYKLNNDGSYRAFENIATGWLTGSPQQR